MKNKKILIFVILIIAAVSIHFLFTNKAKLSGHEKITSGKKETGERKILYYKSPMDPNYISEEPGKDMMGMDLIPVYEGEEQQEGVVKIDPTTIQNMGVRTELITERTLNREIRTVGRVTYDEQRIAYINTKIGGWIEKLYVNYEGQDVKKGDPLLEIYSPELVATQEEFLLALEYEQKMKQSNIQEVTERAHTLLESARRRLEYWDIPDVHIKELEETGQVRKTLMIHSPATGVVVHKSALEGKYAKPGENLYRIADLSKVWVYADIYEYELPWVKLGQEVEMSLSYLAGKVFKGKITYLYPYLESRTRTVKARIEFDNLTGELKPDMYADVKVDTAPSEAVVVVPKEAVIHSGERKVLIIDKGKGLFEPRDILVGIETKDFYEVAHGAKSGERVVTSAQFLIDSESQLNEAISKMLKSKKASSSRAEEVTDMPKHESHEGMKMAKEPKETTRNTMNDIWEAYFDIREELSKDSLANITEKADLIKDRANSIVNSNEEPKIKSIAQEIVDSVGNFYIKDIGQVRDGFLELSNAMIQYMKNFDRGNSKTKNYKLFYCGMEKKPWIQKKVEIGNPYVSESIAFCGALDDY